MGAQPRWCGCGSHYDNDNINCTACNDEDDGKWPIACVVVDLQHQPSAVPRRLWR